MRSKVHSAAAIGPMPLVITATGWFITVPKNARGHATSPAGKETLLDKLSMYTLSSGVPEKAPSSATIRTVRGLPPHAAVHALLLFVGEGSNHMFLSAHVTRVRARAWLASGGTAASTQPPLQAHPVWACTEPAKINTMNAIMDAAIVGRFVAVTRGHHVFWKSPLSWG